MTSAIANELGNDGEHSENSESEHSDSENSDSSDNMSDEDKKTEKPDKGTANPSPSAADVAAAARPGQDIPGYKSSPFPKSGGPAKLAGIKVPKGYSLKLQPPKVFPKEIEGYWESFFTQKRGEKCSGNKVLRYELQKIGIGIDGKKMVVGKGPFGWIKQWGFGPSAYFFDFLDPSLRPLHIDEFKKIWAKFSKYPREDNNLYKDPFNLKRTIPADLDAASKQRIQDEMTLINKNLETDLYKISLNAVQLNAGIRENRWHKDISIADNAKAFIKSFDINGDGRLGMREFILGSIYHNKGILGSDDCSLCYEDLTDKIDGIFAYIDCDNDGLVSSEEIFEHLPKLRRETTKWNLFTLAPKAMIRTAATNDFILKNNYTVKGLLSKSEFRLGVLLGFWDRQVIDRKILEDDSHNMKKLRWKDDDVVDIGAMDYIQNRAEAKAEEEKRKRAAEGDTKVEISMAPENGVGPNGPNGP